MDDLISRKDALKALNEAAKEANKYNNNRISLANMIRHDIKTLPPSMQWIPCKERLPEQSGTYLVTLPPPTNVHNFIDILDYTRVKGFYWATPYGDYLCEYVLAWMPLPEPYKEG